MFLKSTTTNTYIRVRTEIHRSRTLIHLTYSIGVIINRKLVQMATNNTIHQQVDMSTHLTEGLSTVD